MILRDALEVEITVNGEPLPVGKDILHDLTVTEHVHGIPTFDMKFTDVAGFFPQGKLGDGAQISLKMNAQQGDEGQTKAFRRFNINEAVPTTRGYVVQMSGYIDNPQLFRKNHDEVVNGTSADVISKIAKKAGLHIDTDSANDKMKWLPDGTSMLQYMRKTMDHSKSANGALQLAITHMNGQWAVRFKDVIQQLMAGPSLTMRSQGLPGDGPFILNHMYKSLSGALNAYVGYSSQVVQQGLDGILNAFDITSLVQTVESLGMNSSVMQDFAGGFTRREIFPPFLGNTFQDYAKSKNQNQRSKATMSSHLHILTQWSTQNTPLLSPISAQLAINSGLDTNLSGTYLLLGRTQRVTGNLYVERLHLSNQGGNEKG